VVKVTHLPYHYYLLPATPNHTHPALLLPPASHSSSSLLTHTPPTTSCHPLLLSAAALPHLPTCLLGVGRWDGRASNISIWRINGIENMASASASAAYQQHQCISIRHQSKRGISGVSEQVPPACPHCPTCPSYHAHPPPGGWVGYLLPPCLPCPLPCLTAITGWEEVGRWVMIMALARQT